MAVPDLWWVLAQYSPRFRRGKVRGDQRRTLRPLTGPAVLPHSEPLHRRAVLLRSPCRISIFDSVPASPSLTIPAGARKCRTGLSATPEDPERARSPTLDQSLQTTNFQPPRAGVRRLYENPLLPLSIPACHPPAMSGQRPNARCWNANPSHAQAHGGKNAIPDHCIDSGPWCV
jgi:hypothetical protein